jgi:flagellar biosynthesis protein FlhF
MRLRSSHGVSLSDAMQQVRAALGNDAIIVATRDDEEGGVRVTAALDDTPPPAAAETEQETAAPAPAGSINYGHDVVEVVAEQLLNHGVSPGLAETLLTTVTHFADHDALIALGAAMDKHLRFAPLFDGSHKPLFLIGPPGAGKTLCIAKLAASRVLNKKTVGVVTTDLVRAGAVEQLSSYTKLLKLNLLEVEDAPALRDAIEAHPNGELILIDTTGRNYLNKADMLDLKRLITAAPVQPVLVIPAGLDSQEAVDMARIFREAGADRMIITKTDMVRRMGSLLAMAHQAEMALTEMSQSPRATDPLIPLNPVTFARLMLPPDVVASAIKSRARN